MKNLEEAFVTYVRSPHAICLDDASKPTEIKIYSARIRIKFGSSV
jgi:hypothetical protein